MNEHEKSYGDSKANLTFDLAGTKGVLKQFTLEDLKKMNLETIQESIIKHIEELLKISQSKFFHASLPDSGSDIDKIIINADFYMDMAADIINDLIAVFKSKGGDIKPINYYFKNSLSYYQLTDMIEF